MTLRTGARLLVAAVIAFVALCAPPGPVSAHGVDPTVKVVIDAVDPAVANLTVQVVDSVTTELVVDNPTTTELDVLADTGEAFLRIGPDGVHANLSSPSWYLSNDPFGGPVPADASATSASRWVLVSAEAAWGWFDHRLHPSQVTAAEGDEHLPWTVPIRYGEQAGAIRGHLEWRRFTGGYTARLVGGDRPFPGVTVQLLDGRLPGLLLRNDGPTNVTVLGAAGEPFARIGPGGVEVNRRSPGWLANAQAQGQDLTGIEADPAAAPDWFSLGPDRSLSWLEARGRYPNDEPPSAAATASTATVVLDWSVPIEQDGQTASVRAVTAWVPASPAEQAAASASSPPSSRSSGLSGPVLVVAAGTPLVALAVLLAIGRRRRERSSPT